MDELEPLPRGPCKEGFYDGSMFVQLDPIGVTNVLIRFAQAMAASANPILANKEARDPTLFCTGYKRQRFYMFTRTEPEYATFLSVTPALCSNRSIET